MKYSSKRSKDCDIPAAVKHEVSLRDDGLCIFCKRPGSPNAHIIPRSHGGLGIAKNIVTACAECHFNMDNSNARQIYIDVAKRYLRSKYEDWNEDDLVFRKG